MTDIRARLLAGLAAAQLAALAACHPTPGERTVIDRWLLCEECTSGELDAVAALGDRATGTLSKALRDGPSISDREHIRRQAASRYTRLRAPTVTLSSWVGHYESSYVDHYQAHAATALGRIGTPAARAALLDAVQRDTAYGRDVRRALAYAEPVALAPAAGDTQAAPPDSFLRIDPAVLVRDSITGARLANVTVDFRVDSGGGHVTDSVRRTDANGLASVRWALGNGSSPDSFNVLRASALRRSVSFHATSHGFRPRLVFVVPPSNGKRGLPIAPPIRVLAVDAWDRRDTTVAGLANMRVIGTSFALTAPVVAGALDLPRLVPDFSGTGFRLLVQLNGATRVVSKAFDVVP